MKQKHGYLLGLLFFVIVMTFQLVMAVDFNQDPSNEDKATFDQILSPVMKIYNLVKYGATVLAVVVLLFAGITFIASAGNASKREQAKNMAMYVIIGLIVIWAAPLVVNFIVS
ncbi:MAG: pilin [Candidatus Pacearchaeota archaeon]|jgi:cation transport ATPase